MAGRRLDVAVVEPRDRLGRGVAYDTADPDHRLNAPLAVHFVYPDAPDHLLDWYAGQGGPARDPEARAADGSIYMRRGDFGRYVEAQLLAHVDANPSGSTLRHVRARVLDARRTSGGYGLVLDDGRTLSARLAVLATGYDPPPAPPPFDGAASGHAGFLADPWDAARLREIPADARVLVLGMAQTASDAIAVLLRSGREGPVTAVSRRGLRPRRRPVAAPGPPPDVVGRVVRPTSLFTAAHGRHGTVLGLLRTLRSEVRRAEAAGGAWPEPFGDLRDSVWELWPALPLAEKRRFLRHLRVWYDVHRFQLPPPVEARIAEAEAAGQLSFEAASCVAAARRGGALSVVLRPRGGGAPRRKTFDAVVNCARGRACGRSGRRTLSCGPWRRAATRRPIRPASAWPWTTTAARSAPTGARTRACGSSARRPAARSPTSRGAAFIVLRLCRIMPGIAAALRGGGPPSRPPP